jgi:hypothetical protein
VEWLNVTAESGLWGLLAASFLSATVLPGGSEALLWGFLNFTPTNMAGAGFGHAGQHGRRHDLMVVRPLLPRWQKLETCRTRTKLERWGSPALLLAWAPLIGDALCVRRRLAAPALAAVLPVHGARQVRPLLAGGADGTAKLNALPVQAGLSRAACCAQYAKIHFLTDPGCFHDCPPARNTLQLHLVFRSRDRHPPARRRQLGNAR